MSVFLTFVFAFLICHSAFAQLTLKESWDRSYKQYISIRNTMPPNEHKLKFIANLCQGAVEFEGNESLTLAYLVNDYASVKMARASAEDKEEDIIELYKKSLSIIEINLTKQPNDNVVLSNYKTVAHNLANYYKQKGKTEEARQIYIKIQDKYALNTNSVRFLVYHVKYQLLSKDQQEKLEKPSYTASDITLLSECIINLDSLIKQEQIVNNTQRGIEACLKSIQFKEILLSLKPDSTYLRWRYYDTQIALANFYLSQSPPNLNEVEKIYLTLKDNSKKYYLKMPKDTIESIYYAAYCNNLGSFYTYQKPDWKEAEALHKEALKIREPYKKKYPTHYISSYNNLSGLYNGMEDFKKSDEHILRAFQLSKELLPPNHPEGQYYYLGRVANIYARKQEYQKVDSLYAIFLPWIVERYGYNSPMNVAHTTNLAQFKYYAGKYKEALELLNICQNICIQNKGTQSTQYVDVLSLFGSVYYASGLKQEGIKMCEESLSIAEKIYSNKLHPTIISLKKNLAISYKYLNDYGKASEIYEKLRDDIEKLYTQNSESYASICKDLSVYFTSIGLHNRAKEEAQKYLDVEIKLNQNLLGILDAKTNLAIIYKNLGKSQEAQKFTEEVIAAFENKSNKLTVSDLYYNSLNTLGTLYTTQTKYDKAIPILQKAVKGLDSLSGKINVAYLIRLDNLSLAYLQNKQTDKAEKTLVEAKEIAEKYFSNTPEHAHICAHFARIKEIQGKYTEAALLHEEVSQNLIKHIKNSIYQLSSSERNTYLTGLKNAISGYAQFVASNYKKYPQMVVDFYKYHLHTKNVLLLLSQDIRKIIMESGNVSLKNDYLSMKEFQDRLSKLYQKSPTKEISSTKIASQIRILQDSISYIEKRILKSPLLQNKIYNTDYTWTDVKNKLKSNECLVDIVYTKGCNCSAYPSSANYLAFVSKPQGSQVEMYILPEGEKLDSLYYIDYFKSITDTSKNTIIDTLSYNRYWKDIAQYTKGFSKIYFSPDQIYYSLNPYTLYNATTKKYLVADSTNIVFVGSPKDLLKAKKKQSDVLTALLLGNPDFSGSSISKINYDTLKNDYDRYKIDRGIMEKLPELKFSEDEVREIQKKLEKKQAKVDVFLGGDAQESMLKAVKSPTYIHIATHGHFWQKNVDTLNITSEIYQENPLLRSWLFLADCQNPKMLNAKEDGILTAYEALNLNLDETKLVVLSACQTGVGVKQSSEGQYNMQRAFQQAGAEAVLSSLYNINDYSTKLLMSTFYGFLTNGLSPQEAIKKAQNEMLEKSKYKKPYYWGGFLMVGD